MVIILPIFLISFKGYASRAEKDEGKQPMIQRFVKISIVERQPEGNVENYRDPLCKWHRV